MHTGPCCEFLTYGAVAGHLFGFIYIEKLRMALCEMGSFVDTAREEFPITSGSLCFLVRVCLDHG